MGCGATTVKVSFLIFNVIFAFAGIATIAWIAFNPDALPEYEAIVAYIVGSLIVLFALLGCLAALRESVCITATCAAFLLTLAIVQIAAALIDLNDGPVRTGVATVQRAWEANEMDALQSEYQCCGRVSPNDYIMLKAPIPWSCYGDREQRSVQSLYTVGCTATLQDVYNTERMHIAIIAWVLVAFELLGFLLAVFVAVNIRNRRRRMQF